ncbi:unnamed protein product [Pneumocystis jirovecii]|uniref:Exonuclease domain-containing protein n=1 Tax=Pneumocystis jirovecii TaxID=42068 RepID=L0PDI0_PNEJI|nr:unnamed protein product [Pneumocystis jirovecii]
MSGLNPEKHELLEIAVLITDGNLNILEEKGFERVIHHPEYILNSMDAWCKKNHEKSGLIQSVLSSPHTLASTELELLEYLQKVIDVSTIKELARRWNYYVFQNAPKKKANHRAMDDIRESIEELRYYKKTWLI